MFDFFCWKMPGLIKPCFLRTVVIVGIVMLILWIVTLYTSDPATVVVPPLSSSAQQNAKLYFGQSTPSNSGGGDDSNTNHLVNGTRHSIVIVGGGTAGLFAGYTLKYLGIDDFVILEANPNVYGGRVRQRPSASSNSENDTIKNDVPIDLGAEWIHVQPRILSDLLLFDDDRQVLESEDTRIETIVYQPQTFDVSRYPGHRASRNWLRFFYAEYKFYNTTWFQYLERYVYPYVASHLRLDAVVQSIDYTDPSKISVTTATGMDINAEKVILAVPITALQEGYSNRIEFIPGLPLWKQNAINKVSIADGMKLWLEFEERFYADMVTKSSLFDYGNDDPIQYFDAMFRKPSTKHILAQFLVGGPDVDRVQLSDEEAVQAALNDLDQLYNGKASQFYTGRYLVQNWSKEQFIQGAYPINYDGYWDDLPTLQQPVDDRLYFAGSYMHEEITTVHGAALSGRRAADQLLVDAGAR